MKVMGYPKLLVNRCTVLPGDTFLLTKGAGVGRGSLIFLTSEELIIWAGSQLTQASLAEKAQSENRARHLHKDLGRCKLPWDRQGCTIIKLT